MNARYLALVGVVLGAVALLVLGGLGRDGSAHAPDRQTAPDVSEMMAELHAPETVQASPLADLMMLSLILG